MYLGGNERTLVSMRGVSKQYGDRHALKVAATGGSDELGLDGSVGAAP